MRIVLLGDSHLARLRRDLPLIGNDVANAAVGGATVLDLEMQAIGVILSSADTAVVSVGTNEAAPWNAISVPEFQEALTHFMVSAPVRSWVILLPPGVDEERLGPGDRTQAVVTQYRAAAVSVAESCAARVLDPRPLIAPLGPRAFVHDGLHLSGEAYRLLLPALALAVSAKR
ncbi:GDSL-type esterase/lipase family protein [Nocardioides sp. GCM10027113]|uniref:GDSL-type esterase/lipase family protein n=1 Tax=unclassified Nocardioides TaxID=2615069 RepID=UPI003614A106